MHATRLRIGSLGLATAVALAGATVGASVGATGSPAPSRTVDRALVGYRLPAVGRADSGWIGSRRIEPGVTVFRVDPLATAAASAYGRAHAVRRLSRPGRHPTAGATARAAWVVSTYGTVRLKPQAAAVDAAIYHLLVGGRWRYQRARGASRIARTSLPDYVRSYVATMLQDSAKFAGPYRTVLTATPATEAGRTVVRLTVTSARGNPMVERDVTFRYGDRVVRTDTGADGVAGATFDVGTAGVTRVTAVVSQLPDYHLYVRNPRRASASRVVVAGRRIRKVVRADVEVAGVQILGLENARTDYTTAQAIGGTWSLQGHGGERTATFGLFGPFDTAGAASCATAPAESTVRTVDEDGVFPLPGAPVPRVGFYRYGVTVSANETNQVASTCGAPFRVRVVPTVSVAPGRTPVQAGQQVSAKVTVGGLQTTERLTGTVRLYGPFPSTKAATCSAAKLFRTRTVTVSGNGTVATSAVRPTAAGAGPQWYLWTAALAAGEFSRFAASACRANRTFLKVFPN